MGKRIGTGRIESLLENLKREIKLEDSTLKGATMQGHKRTVVETSDNPVLLTTEDAGKIIVLTRGQPQTVNLPGVDQGGDDRIGMEIDIISHTAQNHAVSRRLTLGGPNNNNTLSMISVSEAGTERDHAINTGTSAGAIGDRFNCYYDGNLVGS